MASARNACTVLGLFSQKLVFYCQSLDLLYLWTFYAFQHYCISTSRSLNYLLVSSNLTVGTKVEFQEWPEIFE